MRDLTITLNTISHDGDRGMTLYGGAVAESVTVAGALEGRDAERLSHKAPMAMTTLSAMAAKAVELSPRAGSATPTARASPIMPPSVLTAYKTMACRD